MSEFLRAEEAFGDLKKSFGVSSNKIKAVKRWDKSSTSFVPTSFTSAFVLQLKSE